MARDRKRAKQRRQRREAATPRGGRSAATSGATPVPDPLEHASGEVDIAQAAEEIGLAADDPVAVGDSELQPSEAPAEVRDETADELEHELEPSNQDREGPRSGAVAAREGNRVVNFIRASWAELQRVQWPDRKQVAQATGVVLGFVVIAGGYLGLMDAVFSRVVNAIL